MKEHGDISPWKEIQLRRQLLQMTIEQSTEVLNGQQ